MAKQGNQPVYGYQNYFGAPAAAQAASGGTSIPNRPGAPPNRPTRWTFTLIFAATGVPQAIPGLRVPANCSVWLYAKNGTTDGNAKPLTVGDYRAQLSNGGGTSMMPNDELPWPSENTAAIWAQGQQGDGLIVQVVSNPSSGS